MSNNVVIDLNIVDNVFVKLHHFLKAGDEIEGHAHTFDHITLISSGKVLMKHDNGEQEFKAPHLVVTPKDTVHKFIALEDDTVFCCIHAVRDGNGVDDIASPDISRLEAYNLMKKYPLIAPPVDE